MKVISIRIKPHGQEFVATIIGESIKSPTVGETSVLGPRLVQRIGETEHEAASAALYALFHGEGVEPDPDAPDMRALVREMVEDAQLLDGRYWGYLVGFESFQKLKEAVE